MTPVFDDCGRVTAYADPSAEPHPPQTVPAITTSAKSAQEFPGIPSAINLLPTCPVRTPYQGTNLLVPITL
jgi:hypothetical protein